MKPLAIGLVLALTGCSGGDTTAGFDGVGILRVSLHAPGFSGRTEAWDAPEIRGTVGDQDLAATRLQEGFARVEIQGLSAEGLELALEITDGGIGATLTGPCSAFPCAFQDGAAYAELAPAGGDTREVFEQRALAAVLREGVDRVEPACEVPGPACAQMLAAYDGAPQKDAALDQAAKALDRWSRSVPERALEQLCAGAAPNCGRELAERLTRLTVLATNRYLANRFDARNTARLLLEEAGRAIVAGCTQDAETCAVSAVAFMAALSGIEAELAEAGINAGPTLAAVRAAAAPSLVAELGDLVAKKAWMEFPFGSVQVWKAKKGAVLQNGWPEPQMDVPEIQAEGYFVWVEAVLKNTTSEPQTWTRVAVPDGVKLELVDPFGLSLAPDPAAMELLEHNLGGRPDVESQAVAMRPQMSHAVGWAFDVPTDVPHDTLYLRFSSSAEDAEEQAEGAEDATEGAEETGVAALVLLF
jgi:hypothetical protein